MILYLKGNEGEGLAQIRKAESRRLVRAGKRKGAMVYGSGAGGFEGAYASVGLSRMGGVTAFEGHAKSMQLEWYRGIFRLKAMML